MERRAVVVCAKDEFPFVLRSLSFAQTNDCFGAIIDNMSSLAGQLRVAFSMRTSLGPLDFARPAERGPIPQEDSKPRRPDDLLVAE